MHLDQLNRRGFIALLGGMAAAWSVVAHAQQPHRMKRVAMINPSTKPADMRIAGDPIYTTIFEEMKRLGYVEGTNLFVDRYSAEGRFDRFPEIAREVVATQPDVISVISTRMTLALQSVTRTIPIVAWMTDPVAAGIASSLARPGGNVTGVSVDAGVEIAAKDIELLSEAVGKLSNVRLLATPATWDIPNSKAMREAAEKMSIPFRLEPLQSPIDEAEYRRAFDAMQRDHVDGVVISNEPEHLTNSRLLGQLAQEYRVPAICAYSSVAEAGALMSYAFDLKAGARRVAAQIVEILNGGKPAEMPFFQETHWELVINLKAAKELGLKIPVGLVVRADRVIE
jgi:putative tryptophan/tyrosine transport system substrate-binding protein